MSGERLEINVTFDAARGYIASGPELREPIVALSLANCASASKSRYYPPTSCCSLTVLLSESAGALSGTLRRRRRVWRAVPGVQFNRLGGIRETSSSTCF